MNLKQTPAAGSVQAADLTVFIDPVSYHWEHDRLFDPELSRREDDRHAPFLMIKQHFASLGIAVHTADYLVRGEISNRVNAYLSMGNVKNYQTLAQRPDVVLLAYFTLESPTVQPSQFRHLPHLAGYFQRLYSYVPSTALARFGAAAVATTHYGIPQAVNGVIEAYWRHQPRRHLALINANKMSRDRWRELYTERLRAIEYFARYNEIDLYGRNWDGPTYQVGETWIPVAATNLNYRLRRYAPWPKYRYESVIKRVYRGPVESKYETLKNYTFAICYENAMIPGYISEKVFDCLVTGTIPIYLGAPDITSVLPASCFIDRRLFADYADLRGYLQALRSADLARYREAGRAYLASTAFQRFRPETFVALVVEPVMALLARSTDTALRAAPRVHG